MFWMPETIEELISTLKERNDDTWLCAGGTDLVIASREKKKFHFSLIDLTHLPDLRRIESTEDCLLIGSAVTMDELERSPVISSELPALAKAASMVGSTQIRNRATIGGNVANASQSSDLTPVLMAYDAVAVILDDEGNKRELSVDELVSGLGKTVLGPREVILYFYIKDREKEDSYSSFSKVGSRKAVTISKLNACGRGVVKDAVLTDVVIYLGAVGPKGKKAPLIEAALEGKKLSELPCIELKDAVYRQIEENIPDRSSKHYKKSAAFGLICDIVEDFKSWEKGGKM